MLIDFEYVNVAMFHITFESFWGDRVKSFVAKTLNNSKTSIEKV